MSWSWKPFSCSKTKKQKKGKRKGGVGLTRRRGGGFTRR